jgi:Glycosyltransferase family 10 (fucosyltransferase) C-term
MLLAALVMESAANYEEQTTDSYYSNDRVDIVASYRRFVDDTVAKYLPTSYFPLPFYAVTAAPVPTEEKHSAVLAVMSNCKQQRLRMLRTLHESGIDVHLSGRCASKAKDYGITAASFPHQCKVRNSKVCFARHYKFLFAVENSSDERYMTEKIWDAFSAGVIPIYQGAPDIHTYLPDPKSAIVLSDFQSLEEAAARIKRIASSDALYNEYLAWRLKPPSEWNPHFLQLYEEQPSFQTRFACRVCELAQQMKQQIGQSKI